ncbi:MAG: type II secretion system GspH family protein [Planctomycetota bacterium]|nr:type II secretion system GspH family protein [Planctomycetota bacterium]
MYVPSNDLERRGTRARRGFTLLEVLAVMAILALLLGVGLWGYRASRTTVARSAAQADLTALRQAIETYRELYEAWPAGASNAEIVRTLRTRYSRDPVLERLKDRQVDAEGNWIDPWGRPYEVEILPDEDWRAAEAAVREGSPEPLQRYWVQVVKGQVNAFSRGLNGSSELGYVWKDGDPDGDGRLAPPEQRPPLFPSAGKPDEVDDIRAGSP